jgi:hypothetical protein
MVSRMLYVHCLSGSCSGYDRLRLLPDSNAIFKSSPSECRMRTNQASAASIYLTCQFPVNQCKRKLKILVADLNWFWFT